MGPGRYQPIDITEQGGGVFQGHSPALNLHLRWEAGELALHDPATCAPIATFESARARAENAEAELGLERKARVRELEKRLRQQGA